MRLKLDFIWQTNGPLSKAVVSVLVWWFSVVATLNAVCEERTPTSTRIYLFPTMQTAPKVAAEAQNCLFYGKFLDFIDTEGQKGQSTSADYI